MKKSVVVSLLLAAACGDNIAPPAGDPDAAPDPGPDAAVTAKAIITAGDFNVTGTIATIALPSRTVTANAVAGVAQGDPIIRRFGSEVVIVNRQGGDNVTVLDATTLQLVGEQMATGAGSNPQDVAAVGRKLYLPALGTTGVVVLNRDQPATPTTIDLSAFDADGRPDCNSAYAVDNRVYVVCGILDSNFMARGNGRVAVIDAATDTVIDDFDLGIQNPNGQVQRTPEDSVFGGDLLIPAVPSYSDFSQGCLARVRVGADAAANGCVVTNQALGGYPKRVAVSADGATLWVNVAGYATPPFADPFGRIVAVDLATGQLRTPITPAGRIIGDLAACPGGWVVAADVTFGASGVRVYLDGAELTTAPLDIGTAPSIAGNNIVCL
jgi:hypothetical protein